MTCIYVIDSGGALTIRDVADRFVALEEVLARSATTGMHAHYDLSVGVANSLSP